MESDERFKHLAEDPRFKKLRRKKLPTDERFEAIHTDERFTSEGKDKRGWYSSDASSSSDESDSEEELDVADIKYDWQPLDHDAEKADSTSNRLAIQNLDWDHLDVKDIYILVNSIRAPRNVRIYVSEFGKERLEREEKEGPEELADLAKVDEDEEELEKLEARMKLLEDQEKVVGKKFKINEYEDADEALDLKNEELRERIRRYQLNRMKYYYAIVEFDCAESAEAVYKELDGMEYEGSSLELDLRFVPDDVQFDSEDMKSECDALPDSATYKAPNFINSALQQTTVKFTWDETDIKRQEKLRKAYTKEELEKDDLEAYLASDTDDDDEAESDAQDEANEKVSVITGNSEARANKYKMLLQNLELEEAKKKKVDIDVVWGEYDEDEAAVDKDESQVDDTDQVDDDDDDDECLSSSDDMYEDAKDNGEEVSAGDDDEVSAGDDDTTSEREVAVSKLRKKDKRTKKNKKGKKRADHSEEEVDEDLNLMTLDVDARATEEFKFNPDDDRFKAIYESGLYNIDPSHPNFKKTEAFDQMAERKRRKRQRS